MKAAKINLDFRNSVTELFDFLKESITYRLKFELNGEFVKEPRMRRIENDSALANYILENEFGEKEILQLLLALVPHVKPDLLGDLVSQYLPGGGEFVEFGGIKGKNRGILPTLQTLLFVLGGNEINERIRLMQWVLDESSLSKKHIVKLGVVPKDEPLTGALLTLDEEFVFKLTMGKAVRPSFSPNFPANLLTTGLEWDDLVLAPKTLSEIEEIEVWLKFNEAFQKKWKMSSKIKPGYRVIFHGISGTGKTLTAALLGKSTGRDVYRVDLSRIVSKYIGETTKNIANLFDKAANKDWLLFIDEGDVLLGKRTNIKDSHDKHSNEETSYLLQRIETHPGLVIVATNFKTNMDTAFIRRFQSIISFETPTYKERVQLWKNYLPEHIKIGGSLSIETLAKKYTLTGANILNIVQCAGLKSVARGDENLKEDVLLEAIQKEYFKEGKTFND